MRMKIWGITVESFEHLEIRGAALLGPFFVSRSLHLRAIFSKRRQNYLFILSWFLS